MLYWFWDLEFFFFLESLRPRSDSSMQDMKVRGKCLGSLPSGDNSLVLDFFQFSRDYGNLDYLAMH